jgi:hypothetical protein
VTFDQMRHKIGLYSILTVPRAGIRKDNRSALDECMRDAYNNLMRKAHSAHAALGEAGGVAGGGAH